MNVRVYKNFSKRINSTKIPESTTQYKDFEVSLKQATNRQSPVFILSADSDQFNYNYVYVGSWGRYYFINDIVKGNNNLFEIHCSFDALATYKLSIGSNTCFIERCADANYYNPDIPDSALSVEDDIQYSDSASTSCGFSSGLIYIVRVLGRDGTGGIGTFVMNSFTFSSIFSTLWQDIDDDPSIGDIADLVTLYMSNPAQYIVGVYSTPLGATAYSGHIQSSTLYMGGHETNATLDKITSGNAIVQQGLVLNKPSSHYSDFRKTDGAFSQYTLYIPTIGTVGLSPDIMGTTLTMDISADLYCGDVMFILKSDGDVIATYNSNVYASLSIGSVNQASGIINGAMQTALSVMTGNVVGAIQGIKQSMTPTTSVIGSQGGTGCAALANDIVITCQQKASAEFPLASYGRPCCKNLQIQNLSGYIKCGNASISLAGTDQDKNQVNELLNSGFYYE